MGKTNLSKILPPPPLPVQACATSLGIVDIASLVADHNAAFSQTGGGERDATRPIEEIDGAFASSAALESDTVLVVAQMTCEKVAHTLRDDVLDATMLSPELVGELRDIVAIDRNKLTGLFVQKRGTAYIDRVITGLRLTATLSFTTAAWSRLQQSGIDVERVLLGDFLAQHGKVKRVGYFDASRVPSAAHQAAVLQASKSAASWKVSETQGVLEIRLRSFANLATRIGAVDSLDARAVAQRLAENVVVSARFQLSARQTIGGATSAAASLSDVSFCIPTSATDVSGADALNDVAAAAVEPFLGGCRAAGSNDAVCGQFLAPGRVVHEFAGRGVRSGQSVSFDTLCYRTPFAGEPTSSAVRPWSAGHYCVLMSGSVCPAPLVRGSRRHAASKAGYRGCDIAGGAVRVPSPGLSIEAFFFGPTLPADWTVSGGWRRGDNAARKPFCCGAVHLDSTNASATVDVLSSPWFDIARFYEAEVSFHTTLQLYSAGSRAIVRVELSTGSLRLVREFTSNTSFFGDSFPVSLAGERRATRARLQFAGQGDLTFNVANVKVRGAACRAIATSDASLLGGSTIVTPSSAEYSWCCSDDAATRADVPIAVVPGLEERLNELRLGRKGGLCQTLLGWSPPRALRFSVLDNAFAVPLACPRRSTSRIVLATAPATTGAVIGSRTLWTGRLPSMFLSSSLLSLIVVRETNQRPRANKSQKSNKLITR